MEAEQPSLPRIVSPKEAQTVYSEIAKSLPSGRIARLKDEIVLLSEKAPDIQELWPGTHNLHGADIRGACSRDIMRGRVVFERDGSLNSGFEIISNPMTFNYIMENKINIKNMLQELINNGYISHDSTTCGLHIHLSKNYFTENQIDKLQFLIERFKKELIIFSRRTSEQINSWAKFITDYPGTENEKINLDFIKKYKNKSERYQVLNLSNSDTIEFRLIRGTLKTNTFLASIELLHNMAGIVKRKSLKDLEKITFADLIDYGKYNKELKKYCIDKKLIADNTTAENITNNIDCVEVMALCV